MSNLTSIVKSIQNIMRQDSGVDGDAQRIGQLTWLFFLKIFDAHEEQLELLNDHYRSPLPDDLRWRAWAADPEGRTGDDLLDFVNNRPDSLDSRIFGPIQTNQVVGKLVARIFPLSDVEKF